MKVLLCEVWLLLVFGAISNLPNPFLQQGFARHFWMLQQTVRYNTRLMTERVDSVQRAGTRLSQIQSAVDAAKVDLPNPILHPDGHFPK